MKKENTMDRTDIINAVIKATESARYLEIGVRNPMDNFALIECDDKTGVDPTSASFPELVKATSDEFFSVTGKSERYGVIFVDGDHRYEQVKKDVANALKHIEKGGAVIMHDCNPASADAALPEKPAGGGPWNGEAWRVYCYYRGRKDVRCYCVDCDHGVGIIVRGRGQDVLRKQPADWSRLHANRVDALNLIGPRDLAKLLERGL
jgi:hypothetical protein